MAAVAERVNRSISEGIPTLLSQPGLLRTCMVGGDRYPLGLREDPPPRLGDRFYGRKPRFVPLVVLLTYIYRRTSALYSRGWRSGELQRLEILESSYAQ